jgi:hypothetical protein
MAQTDDDLAAILADYVGLASRGVVVWRNVTLNAVFGEEQVYRADTGGEQVLLGERAITVQTSALPTGAVVGDSITIDGASYQVRDIRRINDGGLTVVAVVPT